MRDWRIAFALLLPLFGLGAGIVRNELDLAATKTWIIPVEGYDPRDPLRGHYVNFRYRWQVEGESQLCDRGACKICLDRRGDAVIARIVPDGPAVTCANMVDPKASNIAAGFSSRIFVSEASAPELEAALRQGPVDVVALLSRDGRLINKRLQPQTAGTETQR